MPSYVLDDESVKFLVKAGAQTRKIRELSQLLTTPQDFANRYSLTLSSNVKQRLLNLGQVNQSHGFAPNDPVTREAISFYNKVLIDGRYIEKWTTDPAAVATALNIQVSTPAINVINAVKVNTLVDTNLIGNPGPIGEGLVAVVIGVIIVIVLVFIPSCVAYDIQALVVDPATMNKV